jgi:sulfate adenylyltransferase subunit 2
MPLVDLATGALVSDPPEVATLLEPDADESALKAAAGGNAGPVAINFPVFGDGRGISLAVILRQRHGFTGEIRAVGYLIPDLAQFLFRSGFDTAEIADPEQAHVWKTSGSRITRNYQRGFRDPAPLRRDAARKEAEALDLRLARIKSLTDRIREIGRRIEGRIAFSTSLGLEDQAILHAIAESGAKIDVFTLDTGRLFPEVLETVELSELRYRLRIRLVTPEPSEVESLVAHDGVLGFRHSVENRKACCEIRKVRPLNRELEGAQGWISGLRREHSDERASVPLAEWDADEGQSGRRLDHVRPHCLHRRQQHSGQSAACARLRLDRLRALHPRGAAGRASARRPVVVGKRGEEGMRAASQSEPGREGRMTALTSHLKLLEAESIHIFREAAAQFRAPVLLYSIGKDSTVLLHLARKAFWPAKPPFPLLHVDTTWKFREMIAFRDRTAREFGLDLIVHTNHDGLARNMNPFDYPPSVYTDVMKTVALRQALDTGGFDAAFGGARRDEESSRAKERVFSFRAAGHRWEPRRQRPEMWQLLNGRLGKDETVRVFPLSNWTESDVWRYVALEKLDVVPLYFAAPRPVVTRNGQLIVVDDARMQFEPGEKPVTRTVRFRTLGCWPLTAAIESDAADLDAIVAETLAAKYSERAGRLIDHDQAGAMEMKKREGYF